MSNQLTIEALQKALLGACNTFAAVEKLYAEQPTKRNRDTLEMVKKRKRQIQKQIRQAYEGKQGG